MSVTSERVKVESDTSVEYNAQELATQIVGAHKKVLELQCSVLFSFSLSKTFV